MTFWKDLWSGSLPSQDMGPKERPNVVPRRNSTPPPSPTSGRGRTKYEEGVRLRDSDDVEDKRAALKAFMDAAEDPECVEASVEVAKFFLNLDAKKHEDVWRPYATRAFTADSTTK